MPANQNAMHVLVLSSSILIDSSLREKTFFDIHSGEGTLIARKTIFVSLNKMKKDMSSN
jgi:hypothetical protein